MRGFRRLRGRVLDEGGQPRGGARVVLAPAGRSQATRFLLRATRTLVTDDASRTTAADGSFVFDRLDARTYAVSAATDDRYAWPELASAAEPHELVLRLRLGITLVVHVAGERAPIAGATVAFADRGALTDDRGTATIRGLAPCDLDAGLVAADGFALHHFRLSLDEDPDGTVDRFVTLERGARIAGVVANPFGRRVAGADVSVYAQPSSLQQHYETRSDANGTWQLDLPAGTYRAAARTPTYKPMAGVTLACDGRTPQRDVVLRVAFRSPRHALRALLRPARAPLASPAWSSTTPAHLQPALASP